MESEFDSYKKIKSLNEKKMNELLQANLKRMAEMLAVKRDLQNFLKFYREELTNHQVRMQKEELLSTSLEGQIYNEQLKQSNLEKQIRSLVQDIQKIR